MSTATTHFSAIPWCKELIEDEAWTPTRTASRVPKSSSEDSFFAETLQTDRTIRHCLSLRPTNPEHDFQTRGHGPAYKEIRTIIELGNGLNGHPNICHGGFVATLLDEVFGVLLTHNIEMRSRARRDSSRTGRSLPPAMGMNGFTAYLNTSYKKPLPTPCVVLCTARFVKTEGKKTFLTGTIEDGAGLVYATAEAMFVVVIMTKL